MTDVDFEATSDAGGGYNVGWVSAGEWLNYTVKVATAGLYTIEFRVASPGAGGTFHLEVNGSPRDGAARGARHRRLAELDDGRWPAVPLGRRAFSVAAGDGYGRQQRRGRQLQLALCHIGIGRGVDTVQRPAGGTARRDRSGELRQRRRGDRLSRRLDGQQRRRVSRRPMSISSRRATTGGGYNVGWVSAGEWLNYTVDVATAGSTRSSSGSPRRAPAAPSISR